LLFQSGAISTQQMDAARTAYDVAFSQVQQSSAALRTSEVKLKDTVLYAPVSGVVLRKNIEAGETIAAGTPVFTIGDLENPWVKVYVKEDKLGLVKLGQQAQVKTDSYPGKVYEGTITYISSEAEFTPKNVQTQEERVKLVFGLKVSVKNLNDELKPSMPADVRILL
jgi:HlyD family secretion protein